MWIRGVCESEGVLVLFEGQSEEVWKVEHTGQEQTTEGMDGWMESTWPAGMKVLTAAILGGLGEGQRGAGAWTR